MAPPMALAIMGVALALCANESLAQPTRARAEGVMRLHLEIDVPRQASVGQVDGGDLIMDGVVGSLGGILAGGFLGYEFEQAAGGSADLLNRGLVYGALAGSALLSSAIVHQRSGRSGYLGVLAVTGATTLFWWQLFLGAKHPAIILTLPLTQALATVTWVRRNL